MRSGIRPCGRSGCESLPTRRLTAEQVSALGKTIELRVCDGCGLGYLDPRLSEEEVGSLYSESYVYYGDVSSPRAEGTVRWKYRVAGWRYAGMVHEGIATAVLVGIAALAERVFGKTITYSLGLPISLGRSARILDFGCGSGEWLLHLASLGFRRLCGADIGANAGYMNRLKSSGIGAVSIQKLEDLPDASFDVIRLEHVLEHLPQPLSTIGLLRRLLVPGGWLVLTVPSILPWRDRTDLDDSPDRAHLQIPVHLVHQSEESLTQLVEEANLEGVRVKSKKVERFLTAAARRPDGGLPP